MFSNKKPVLNLSLHGTNQLTECGTTLFNVFFYREIISLRVVRAAADCLHPIVRMFTLKTKLILFGNIFLKLLDVAFFHTFWSVYPVCWLPRRKQWEPRIDII